MSVSVATRLREDLQGRWAEPEVEHLLSTAVDDLVKYNIVKFLYEHPAAVGDASFFAIALGFHSTPRTEQALEQLAAAGVLRHWSGPGVGDTVYGLTNDETTLRHLHSLCSLKTDSPMYRNVMRRLAAKSLKRAESSTKHVGSTSGSA